MEFKTYQQILDATVQELVTHVSELVGISPDDVIRLIWPYHRATEEQIVAALNTVAADFERDKAAAEESREYRRAGQVLPPRSPVRVLLFAKPVSRVEQKASGYG